MPTPTLIAVVKPDDRRRIYIGKLLPKMDSYTVYISESGEGIIIEPNK